MLEATSSRVLSDGAKALPYNGMLSTDIYPSPDEPDSSPEGALLSPRSSPLGWHRVMRENRLTATEICSHELLPEYAEIPTNGRILRVLFGWLGHVFTDSVALRDAVIAHR